MKRNDCVAVFGSGTIAARCIKLLRSVMAGEIYIYEKKQSESSILEKRLSTMPDIRYSTIGPGIEAEILNVLPKAIFSINNVYIFPESLANRFAIINYHNALLPKHPGRNAEAWTIFSQDETAGVTWHFVDSHVDTGNIILQKEFPLSADVTSIQLLSIQTKLAYHMFEEILGILLGGGELPRIKQTELTDVKFHFSWEKPNCGELDLSWDISQMYAFLRAMDYGKLFMLGIPSVCLDGHRFTWNRYSLESTQGFRGISIDLSKNECLISKEEGTIKLSGLQILCDGKEL